MTNHTRGILYYSWGGGETERKGRREGGREGGKEEGREERREGGEVITVEESMHTL